VVIEMVKAGDVTQARSSTAMSKEERKQRRKGRVEECQNQLSSSSSRERRKILQTIPSHQSTLTHLQAVHDNCHKLSAPRGGSPLATSHAMHALREIGPRLFHILYHQDRDFTQPHWRCSPPPLPSIAAAARRSLLTPTHY
jgi:hypothetical protein